MTQTIMEISVPPSIHSGNQTADHFGNDFNRLLHFKSEHVRLSSLGQKFNALHILVIVTFQANVFFDLLCLSIVDLSSMFCPVYHLILCGNGDQLIQIHISEIILDI